MTTNNYSERPPGFTGPLIVSSSAQLLITPRNLVSDFEAEGDIVPTPEEQALLKKMRADKMAKKKGKA